MRITNCKFSSKCDTSLFNCCDRRKRIRKALSALVSGACAPFQTSCVENPIWKGAQAPLTFYLRENQCFSDLLYLETTGVFCEPFLINTKRAARFWCRSPFVLFGLIDHDFASGLPTTHKSRRESFCNASDSSGLMNACASPRKTSMKCAMRLVFTRGGNISTSSIL